MNATTQTLNPSVDVEALTRATAVAEAAETKWPMQLDRGMNSDAEIHEPKWSETIGPTQDRGRPNGLILMRGEQIAAWGESSRVDMTFSVTKSFLALLAGIAVGDGLIRSLDDPIRDYELDDGFDSAQNASVTFRHLLEQTSEWEGTLFGKPDQVDHFRDLAARGNKKKGQKRDLQAPGTYWEYNDVRVNRFSLCLLQLFKRPLPEVLAERIMQPIGASETWRWHPYRNAEVVVDGQPMMSVPGGGHWGGGLFISSEDLARVARLVQLGGQWPGAGDANGTSQQILPSGWTQALRTPCNLNPTYGLMWWLNTNRQYVANAPETSYFMVGAGSNIVWLDDSLDLIVVMRWIDRSRLGDIVAAVLDAV